MMRPGAYEKAMAKARLLLRKARLPIQNLLADPKTRIPCGGCGRWTTLRMLKNRGECPACGRPYGPQPQFHKTQEMQRRVWSPWAVKRAANF